MKTQKQIWEKKGLIFKKLPFKWAKSHSMVPTPLKITEYKYRIFFGTRNNKNQSSVGYIDYDFKNFKVIKKSNRPCFEIGNIGSFDDNGVLPSSVLKIKKKVYLFYIGWKPAGTTRYSLITGLAYSNDNGLNFKRVSKSPILFTSNKEPYSILTGANVIKSSKNKFLMWYVSGLKWKNKNLPFYNIKFAHSKNIKDWVQTGVVAIKLKKKERAVARPFVIKEKSKFRMWYCYEKNKGSYNIGYAESKNGFKWKRLDKNIKFIGPKNHWDKKMMEYPSVIQVKNKKYMLYNGNNYGETGIGLAQLIKDNY